MNYTLDTNVFSELVAAQPDQSVVRWIDNIDQPAVYLSVITVGEFQKDIEKMPNSQRKTLLETRLREDLLVRFQDHLLTLPSC